MLHRRNLGSIRENEFFAFVEDSEALMSEWKEPPWDPWLNQLFLARKRMQLPPPTQLLWLDCVSAPYFDQLDFRDEEFSIDNAVKSEQRRQDILALEPKRFRIVPLLLSSEPGDLDIADQLAQAEWHRITIDDTREGLPVLTAPDYDLVEGVDLRYLQYSRECNAAEVQSLRSVFNLDFVPDINLGGDEGPIGGPGSPFGPRPLDEERFRQWAPKPDLA